MQSSAEAPAPGRPREIEAFSNLYLVHPVSRAVVDRLVATPITPNQVSVTSMLAAAAGALCYLEGPRPWGAFAGLACLFVWHVMDGADGDLARRTGRASPQGELIDGVCDHLSQGFVYVAFALILQRTLGGWAWAIGALAALCHFVQANAYETSRKTYRRWVHGAAWMRQTANDAAARGPVERALGGLYLTLSNLADPAANRIEAAMAEPLATEGAAAAAARALYRETYAPLVKTSGVLDSNTRTIAGFLAMLTGGPLWFFLFEILALNLALVALGVARARFDARLLVGLAATPQAASAPNWSRASRA